MRRVFDSVELNTTFYRLPDEAVWDGWRNFAPEGFSYAVKASRSITHFKKLKASRQAVHVLMARAPAGWNPRSDRSYGSFHRIGKPTRSGWICLPGGCLTI